MRDSGAVVSTAPRPRAQLLTHPIVLWAAFVVVHFVLGLLALYGAGGPLGDVVDQYRFWVQYGSSTDVWVGIDTVWVYPIVALVPMLAANLFGPDLYASTWLSLVMLVDAAAFAVLTGASRDRRLAIAGWWWLGFLLLLGPIAVGRVDAITVPFALVGLLVISSRPRLAAVLLTVAAWMKVWPAALVGAAVIAMRERGRIAVTAVATSVVIAGVALLLGSGVNVLSFITQQASRGLQIEAPIATGWMWDAFASRATGGGSFVAYDAPLNTFQVHGTGSEVAAAATTPALVVVTAILLAAALLATRRGVPAVELLPVLALTITVALILFNKVGSPQFVTWLAVPIAFGVARAATGSGRSFRTPAVIALVIAALTQAIYPYLYNELVGVQLPMLLILSARNALYVALFVWGAAALVRLIREPDRTAHP